LLLRRLPAAIGLFGALLAAQEPAAPTPPVLAIVGGTVHPVSGPALQDGVVVITGDRITAVGSKADVAIPAGAKVLTFANAHVYPGLVDALTDAYTDTATRGDGSLDPGTALKDTLRRRGDRDDDLVQAGITTAFVGNRGPSSSRGIGAVVRPSRDSFALFPGREAAALQMRGTNGPGPSHALQRQQLFDGIANQFDGLEAYKKSFEDHKAAAEKYQKEYEDYLGYFRKKKDAEDKSKGGDRPADAPAAGQAGAPGPRGGRRGGGQGNAQPPSGTPPVNPPATPPGGVPTGAQGPPQNPAADAKPEDKPPAKPQFPKEPPRDPAKETLQQVLDGALSLRLEVHRPDEIRAALAMAKEKKVPTLVLEQAYGSGNLGRELADAGVAVVLTEVLPGSLPKEYDTFDTTALPGQLQRAGVVFAIASGCAHRAAALPLIAAAAVGQGLDADAALRALTLSPAEILGVAKDTGSLQPGKLGDVLVCDRPLFASDCRVLAVFAAGQSQYEAK
jgi:imidazolonepropionase-like amidohydrolase